MDRAAHLMTSLPMDRAARDMGGAVDYLRAHPSVSHDQIGALGYCMGGMLTLLVATQQGDKFGAVAPYYGAPLGDGPDWSNLTAPVRGHFAEHDDFFPPAAIKELEQKLRAMGKDVEFEVHAGTGHAFCNEENPLGTHDAGAHRQVLGFDDRLLPRSAQLTSAPKRGARRRSSSTCGRSTGGCGAGRAR